MQPTTWLVRAFVVAAWGATLAGAGCAAPAPVGGVRAPPDPGWVLFTELEERLMRARTIELHATITSSGAVESIVNADLFIEGDARAHFAVAGTFEGAPVRARWMSDGARASGDVGTPAPRDVRAAFVRGLLAMGLMHNAAIVIGGRPPDHADGGVREFVRADRPRLAATGLAIDLDVVVKNAVMGEATLALNEEGLPHDRTQIVHFDEGDMKVHEIYTGVTLDRPLDPALFAWDGAPAVTPSTAPAGAP